MGINLLSAALATDELAVPIGVAFIRKSIKKRCPDGRVRRRSPVTQKLVVSPVSPAVLAKYTV